MMKVERWEDNKKRGGESASSLFVKSDQWIVIIPSYYLSPTPSDAKERQDAGILLSLATDHLFEKGLKEIDGYRKEGGRIVLCRHLAQGLQKSQL